MNHAFQSENAESADTSTLHHPVVLLVDSQAMVGETLHRMLVDETDIEFHHCQAPRQAVLKAIEIRPTVILLEPALNMPDVDGYTLLKTYQNNPATAATPIVMLSLQDDPHAKRRAFELGATDYLVKLPDRIEMVARIRAYSKAHAAHLKRDQEYHAMKELVDELKAAVVR